MLLRIPHRLFFSALLIQIKKPTRVATKQSDGWLVSTTFSFTYLETNRTCHISFWTTSTHPFQIMNNQEIPVENVFSTEFFVDNSAANSSSLAAAKDRKMSSVNNGFTTKHEETL